jgi:hypothetical protein
MMHPLLFLNYKNILYMLLVSQLVVVGQQMTNDTEILAKLFEGYDGSVRPRGQNMERVGASPIISFKPNNYIYRHERSSASDRETVSANPYPYITHSHAHIHIYRVTIKLLPFLVLPHLQTYCRDELTISAKS